MLELDVSLAQVRCTVFGWYGRTAKQQTTLEPSFTRVSGTLYAATLDSVYALDVCEQTDRQIAIFTTCFCGRCYFLNSKV
jgi:hypothetical protein